MRYIYWNIRGIGNIETQMHLFQLLSKHKPEFLFLAEPLVAHHTIHSWYWQKANLQNYVINDRNSIWCLWNSQQLVTILLNKSQCIAFSFLHEGSIIYTAVVYAATTYTIRRELWRDLSTLQTDYPGPWIFVGDYNSILGAHERVGGRTPLHIACYDFKEWSNRHALIHIETNGAQFTWTNRRDLTGPYAMQIGLTIGVSSVVTR
jgi:hypothetical protein